MDHVPHQAPETVSLEPMQQLSEARGQGDNWTGTSDRATRKKLQNRLNQRAYRRRTAQTSQPSSEPQAVRARTVTIRSHLRPPRHALLPIISGQQRSTTFHDTVAVPLANPLPALNQFDNLQLPLTYPPQTAFNELATTGNPVFPCPEHASHSLSRRSTPLIPLLNLPTAIPNSFLQSTSPTYFPLPHDSLLTLIQINVYRALLTNIDLLHLKTYLFPACPSPHTCHHTPAQHQAVSPQRGDLNFPAETLIPPSLRPTELQLAVPHNRWIDIFPHPAVRDNLILAGEAAANNDLCADLVGSMHAEPGSGMGVGDDGEEVVEMGMRVWSDPWDIRSWEVTAGFAQKWGWLMRGAGDWLEASNEWRERRGEERLIVEL
ncbi:hypothetical protein MMC13_003013 [Lambiella insularis]|nr:hypothetical protein [Lambiella insularis]